MDGNWYEFTSSDDWLSSSVDVTIEGNSGSYNGTSFTIDTSKKEFSAMGKVIPYVLEDDILHVDGYTYVKEGSAKYEELLKLAEEKEAEVQDEKDANQAKIDEYNTLVDELEKVWVSSYSEVVSRFFDRHSGEYYLSEERGDSIKVDSQGLELIQSGSIKTSEWDLVNDSIKTLKNPSHATFAFELDVEDIWSAQESGDYDVALPLLKNLIEDLKNGSFDFNDTGVTLGSSLYDRAVVFYEENNELKTNITESGLSYSSDSNSVLIKK